MRVEISMNNVSPAVILPSTVVLDNSQSTNVHQEFREIELSPPNAETYPGLEYISFGNDAIICAAKFWVIKRGYTAATGLGIAVFIVVAFGGVITLLVNPGYDACINTAASMITVGVVLSVICAMLYTKVIGYCRKQEIRFTHLAQELAVGERGASAMVALNHLERPMEVMAPCDVIERAKLKSCSYFQGLPVLQFSRGMTLKYGCTGLDGKSATVYLPDPNAPIDKYPFLKASVIAWLAFFYSGICIVATSLIIWVSAYPDDHQTMTVCISMEVIGGFLSLIGMLIGIYIYTLCMKYGIEDSADYKKNTAYSNPIMTIS